MKRFTVDKAVFEKLPDYCVGVVAALGLDNREHNEALEKLLPRTHNGAVILLHSTSKTNARILQELITGWKEEGYQFASLEKLGM